MARGQAGMSRTGFLSGVFGSYSSETPYTMWSGRCVSPNLRAFCGQELRMACVGDATRRGIGTGPGSGPSVSTCSMSRRPMRFWPTPIATTSPASRRPLTSVRMWPCRACFFWTEAGAALAPEVFISGKSKYNSEPVHHGHNRGRCGKMGPPWARLRRKQSNMQWGNSSDSC